MDKYATIQKVLNKCIEKGRLKESGIKKIFVLTDGVYNEGGTLPIMSYHDLFSADSGLIKFVEWKGVDHEWCRNPVEERGGGIGGESYYGTSTDSYDRKRFHLLEMSDLTAEDKVDYFLENIIDG